MSFPAEYGKNDGLVDRICFLGLRPFDDVTDFLDREKDYDRYKDEFDNADRVLAEDKERFSEYFNF